MDNNHSYELKLLILRHGVNFDDAFFAFPYDAFHLKAKYISTFPVSSGKQVFDISTIKAKIPSEIILVDSFGMCSIVKTRNCESSPVSFRLNPDNTIAIYVNGKKSSCYAYLLKEDLALSELIPRYGENDSRRAQIGDYISIVGLDRISVLFFDGCYNWINRTPCKFCDLHPRRKESKVFIPSANNLCDFKTVDDWWESNRVTYLNALEYSLCRILSSPSVLPHKHLFFMCGNLLSSRTVWNIIKDTLCFLSKSVSFTELDIVVNVPPHENTNDLLFIKELGIRTLQYNIEVIDKELFKAYCPGKIDYSLFIDKLVEAVDYLGAGNIRSNIVLGLQDMKNTLDGCDFLCDKGIVPDYSVFQPKRHTALYKQPSPNERDVIFFSHNLARMYRRYNFTPIFCSCSSRSSIMNEVYYEQGIHPIDIQPKLFNV